jgi:hypothetical protein
VGGQQTGAYDCRCAKKITPIHSISYGHFFHPGFSNLPVGKIAKAAFRQPL